MKKRKRLVKMSSAARKGPIAAATGKELLGEIAFVSAGSLLNKYNQKRPSGTKKLSPAADEEME